MTRLNENTGGKICVTLCAGDVGEAHALAARAKEGGAAGVEYRLDAMPPAAIDVAALLGASPLPAIVTFRRPEDGGLRGEDDEVRIGLLREALRHGATFVDIELGREGELARHAEGRLIVSHHDLEKTPEDLAEIARRIESGPAEVVKIATTARTSADAFRHYEVLQRARKPTVAFAMGEIGSSSRILCLRFGSPFTYAALDDERAAAPGQIPLSQMTGELRAVDVGPGTAVYGVVGHPVGHSMSPAMLNAAFEAAGLEATYLPFDVDSRPAEFVRRMAGLGLAGFSVTIPHKVDVMAALDRVEPAAERIGAVNTVVIREGRLVGTNTDLWGALDAIAEAAGGMEALGGRRALVLGAGGAARAIVFGLRDAGVEVSLTDIVRERAEGLAGASGSEALLPEDVDPGSFDIVANATPVGMRPDVDSCPLAPARLREGQIVFDAVYNPLETVLLREAARRGCRTVRGVEMFVRQGARQFKLWTGGAAPVDIMREVVLQRLSRRG